MTLPLVCPRCHGSLVEVRDHDQLVGLLCDGRCLKVYPVKDGIPVMLVEAPCES